MKRVSSSVPSLEQCHGPVSRRVSVTRRQRRDSGPWHIDLQMSRRLSRRPVVPSLFRPTDDLLLPHENNIEDMWLTFKNVLHSSVEQFIPKNNNFSLWKKDSWDHPIDKNLRKKISRKNRVWTRYIETRNQDMLKNTK